MGKTVAIHGRNGFAESWPAVAERMGFSVRHVNGYSNEVWSDLAGCAALMWVIDHENATDLAHGRQVLLAAEHRGLRVFPNHQTVWHFDDKVAQKYLLEAVGAPLADTWVFFNRQEAEHFLSNASYPLVFKLRRGAGALNVRLVQSRAEGRQLVARMFGSGMRAFPAGESLRRAASRAKAGRPGRGTLVERGRRTAMALVRKLRYPQFERGYVLFQRFIPENSVDVRVTIIGDRAFTFTRGVRPDDFRASGSGLIAYLDAEAVPLDMVDAAFSVATAIGAQSLALDFVRDPTHQRPVLLEMSYSFIGSYLERCPGYYTRDHLWHEGSFEPAELILRDLVDGIMPA